MIARMVPVLAGVAALVLVVAALWGWGQAWWIAEHAHRPQVLVWAIRSGALAAVAAAQVLVLTCVIGALYRRRPLDQMLGFGLALMGAIALVSAIALGVAGH